MTNFMTPIKDAAAATINSAKTFPKTPVGRVGMVAAAALTVIGLLVLAGYGIYRAGKAIANYLEHKEIKKMGTAVAKEAAQVARTKSSFRDVAKEAAQVAQAKSIYKDVAKEAVQVAQAKSIYKDVAKEAVQVAQAKSIYKDVAKEAVQVAQAKSIYSAAAKEAAQIAIEKQADKLNQASAKKEAVTKREFEQTTSWLEYGAGGLAFAGMAAAAVGIATISGMAAHAEQLPVGSVFNLV